MRPLTPEPPWLTRWLAPENFEERWTVFFALSATFMILTAILGFMGLTLFFALTWLLSCLMLASYYKRQ